MESADYADTFWESSQNWTIFGVHFYAFTGFFKINVKNRNIFCGLPFKGGGG